MYKDIYVCKTIFNSPQFLFSNYQYKDKNMYYMDQ